MDQGEQMSDISLHLYDTFFNLSFSHTSQGPSWQNFICVRPLINFLLIKKFIVLTFMCESFWCHKVWNRKCLFFYICVQYLFKVKNLIQLYSTPLSNCLLLGQHSGTIRMEDQKSSFINLVVFLFEALLVNPLWSLYC